MFVYITGVNKLMCMLIAGNRPKPPTLQQPHYSILLLIILTFDLL